MENKKRLVVYLSKAFLSFFGSGFLPFAPGTWGSLACIPLLYFIYPIMPLWAYTLSVIILLFISSWIAHWLINQTKEKDPGWIVIDEVLGMAVAWPALKYFNISEIAALFVLFRIFDIVKIWPASHYDKMNSGWGIMLDDIISGIFTFLALLALHQVIIFPQF